jgi:uncharacterized protein YndB with AHSA1/START domain
VTNAQSSGRTRTSLVIPATREDVYRAFTDPAALEAWQAPGEMTGTVHAFDLRVGGGYEMSLFYPEDDQDSVGKSGGREDRFATRFVELSPPSQIVQVVTFDSDDPAFAGEMTMAISLEDREGGTEVTIAYDGIPAGIRPEDNELGTRLSLEKLRRFVTDKW